MIIIIPTYTTNYFLAHIIFKSHNTKFGVLNTIHFIAIHKNRVNLKGTYRTTCWPKLMLPTLLNPIFEII